MIRLLLDQGLPRRAASDLRTTSWDVIHVSEIGLTQASDMHILDVALQSQRTIVTLDSDFASLVATAMLAAPSVIHIRRGQMDRASTRSLLEQLVPTIQEDLHAGCLASVTDAGSVFEGSP